MIEQEPVSPSLLLEEMSYQEIASVILPVLVAGEALSEGDVELIRGLAAKKLETDTACTLEDALMGAAGERLAARKELSHNVAVVDKFGNVVSVVPEDKEKDALLHAAVEDREHRDHSSSN